jgi:hypothetical protein
VGERKVKHIMMIPEEEFGMIELIVTDLVEKLKAHSPGVTGVHLLLILEGTVTDKKDSKG